MKKNSTNTVNKSSSEEALFEQILRTLVIGSLIITIIGAGVYLYQNSGASTQQYMHQNNIDEFSGAEQYLRDVSTFIPRIAKLDGAAIIQLGVVILILNPVLRVIFAAFNFLRQRDYMYVIISLIVLIIIRSNMFFGVL